MREKRIIAVAQLFVMITSAAFETEIILAYCRKNANLKTKINCKNLTKINFKDSIILIT